MVVFTRFKNYFEKSVQRALCNAIADIMIEFRSVPLSLRHEHQKTTSNQSSFHFKILSTSRPVPYRHQILTKVVVIVIFPIDVHGHAINVCLCYRNVHDSMTVTALPPTLISLLDFG